MTEIAVSAPGKLMLFGEHAVLYGHPCIVTAVDLRMQVNVEVITSPNITIQTAFRDKPYSLTTSQLLGSEKTPKEIQFVSTAIKNFWKETNHVFGVNIRTESQFTHSYGLGSSSAVTVATIYALAHATGYALDLDKVFQLAYESVLEVQAGSASGFDVAAATYGGLLYYVAGGKVIKPLHVEYLPLLVCYSGKKASTVKLVNQVTALKENRPDFVLETMEKIARIVDQAEFEFSKGDFSQLGRLMTNNHQLLQGLGVSTEDLDKLVEHALDGGVYGAKLSGAGGGDCIVAFVSSENRNFVYQSLENVNIENVEVLEVKSLAEGVRLETN